MSKSHEIDSLVRIILLLTLALAATGCATQRPDLTREQYKEMTTRKYPHHSSEEVSKAAEKVLVLADTDDVQFQYEGQSFLASRSWFIYAVLTAASGTDYWRVDLSEANNEGPTKARLTVSQSSAGIAGVGTGGGGVTTATVPSGERPINSPALYSLFWARVDYILEERRTWPDCVEWDKKIDKGETWGQLTPLCGMTLTRERPDGAPDPDPEANSDDSSRLLPHESLEQ